MKVYIVFEYEAHEEGSSESIAGVYLDRKRAEEFAAAQDGGRYMSWRVEDYDVIDASSEMPEDASAG